jgi:hypothetical protein
VITNLKLLKSFFRYHRKSLLLFSGVRIFRPFFVFLRYFPDFSATLRISFKFTGFLRISPDVTEKSLDVSAILRSPDFSAFLRISRLFSGFFGNSPDFFQVHRVYTDFLAILRIHGHSPDFSEFGFL